MPFEVKLGKVVQVSRAIYENKPTYTVHIETKTYEVLNGFEANIYKCMQRGG